MKKTRILQWWAVLFLVLCAPLAGAPADTTESFVAEVNGAKLTERELLEMMNELVPRESFHRTINPERVQQKKREALEELITRELYYQEGKKTIQVKSSEVNTFFDGLAGRFKSKGEFRKALEQGGYTEKEFKQKIEKKLITDKFYEREVTLKAKVSDAYLQDYYDKNKASYFRPEGFRLRHIVIKVPPEATKEEREEMRKKAEEVLKKARAGEDFAQLAWDNSMDDYRVKGGDIGIMHEGMLLPELEQAAFKLKPGQVSDIIETIYGYHIIKVEEKLPSTQMAFVEVKEKLRSKFEKDRSKELEENLKRSLRSKAEIKIYMKE